MSTLPAYVTDATRLLLEDDCPVVDNENAGLRKTGQSKLAIPNGDLAKYVPDWLAKPGVVRHLLDTLTAEEGQALFESLAHPDETTTEARQVRLEDQALIKNQKEQWLEKRAAALLVRAFPAIYGNPAENQDATLTHAGFRAGSCHPSLTGARDAFIVRLVGLQLLIRRGIEIRTLPVVRLAITSTQLVDVGLDEFFDAPNQMMILQIKVLIPAMIYQTMRHAAGQALLEDECNLRPLRAIQVAKAAPNPMMKHLQKFQ